MPSKGPYYDEGIHVGQVLQQGLTKATTGTFQFALTIKVLGVADPHDATAYVPHRNQFQRTIWMAITEKTIEYVVPSLETLGYEGSTFGALDPSHPDHQSFVGKTFDFFCTHEKDQEGNLREKWSVARTAKLPELQPLESREMRQLDALFGRALANKGKKPPASVPSDANEVGITDDDIPF